MKASRKGTRLNDAQYFRQPLPHTRKKMTTMFLLPQLSDLQVNHLFLSGSTIDEPISQVKTRMKDHRTVDIKQSSTEMALLACSSDYSVSKGRCYKDTYQEICMGTEWYPSKVSMLKEPEETPDNLAFKDNVLLPRFERGRYHPQKIVKRNDLEDKDDKKFCDKNRTLDEKIRPSGWWKDSHFRQTILQFFSKILGKREATSTAKKMTIIRKPHDLIVTVDRRFKGNKNRRKYGCGTMHLAGAINPSVGNILKGEAKTRKMDDSCEEVSMLVRQIQRTRDKNLRVTLLEQELRARLPTKTTLCEKIFNVSLASRQISSPLC